MTDYSPSPELVEALRERGFYRADVYDTTRAAVAFRHPDGHPELVPWEQVRELVDAADNAHRALDVVLSIPTVSGGILGAQSVASHAQSVLRAALAPFTQEPNDEG